MTDADSSTLLRSALLVDFDNVYLGLRGLDAAAAATFAKNPARWLRWLETWPDQECAQRRFLSRNCYLNPNPHSQFRSYFTSAGFRVVDCPSLTKQAKNSADISMVIDALDLLAHPVHYDEFIIMSADADFTPLLVRLRTHDRASMVIVAGPAAAPYRAVCDRYVSAADLVIALTEPETSATEDSAAQKLEVLLTKRGEGAHGVGVFSEATVVGANTGSVSYEDDDVARLAAKGIREALAKSVGPLPGARAGWAATRAEAAVAKTQWAGTGSLSAFIEAYMPDLTLVRDNRGGWVLDPARHTLSDIPAPLPELSVEASVARVADIPAMTSQQYGALFDELANDLRNFGPANMRTTPTRVRDAAASHDVALTVNAVRRVLQGPVAAAMFQPEMAADELAEAWLLYVFDRCESAGLELSDADRSVVRSWLTGTR